MKAIAPESGERTASERVRTGTPFWAALTTVSAMASFRFIGRRANNAWAFSSGTCGGATTISRTLMTTRSLAFARADASSTRGSGSPLSHTGISTSCLSPLPFVPTASMIRSIGRSLSKSGPSSPVTIALRRTQTKNQTRLSPTSPNPATWENLSMVNITLRHKITLNTGSTGMKGARKPGLYQRGLTRRMTRSEMLSNEYDTMKRALEISANVAACPVIASTIANPPVKIIPLEGVLNLEWVRPNQAGSTMSRPIP